MVTSFNAIHLIKVKIHMIINKCKKAFNKIQELLLKNYFLMIRNITSKKAIYLMVQNLKHSFSVQKQDNSSQRCAAFPGPHIKIMEKN